MGRGIFTPALRRNVRETLASHGSHQTNLPINVNGGSLSMDGLVPAVPYKSLYLTHAPYTPAAGRPVIRLLAGLSEETASPLVSEAPNALNDASSKGLLALALRGLLSLVT